MQINSNISEVFGSMAANLNAMRDGMLREIAVSMLPVVRDRIHVQGKAADGSQIGEYSEGYMAVRTGIYKSNEKVSKGKNKGQTKSTGVFTKGENKGKQRPNYNRSQDKKVILSLTRQQESDLSVQPTPEGYGLGYNNDANFNKAQWAETTYKKPIFSLTNDEKEMVIEIADSYKNRHLNA